MKNNNNNKQKTVTLSEIESGSFFNDGWKYNNEYNTTPEDMDWTMRYSKNDPKSEKIDIQLMNREN